MNKNLRIAILLAVIFLAAVVAALFAGNRSISFGQIMSVLAGKGSDAQRIIVYKVRIPRIIAASAAGAALSVSGYLLQSSLNNKLASPGILGINNGAGMFVLFYACLFPYRYGGKCIAAFAGAILVTMLIYLLTARGGISRTSVILSGVAVSALCLSVIDMIIFLKPETVADRAAFQLGGFAALNISSVYMAVPVIVICLAIAVLLAPALDLMALGDEVAFGLGLDVRTYRILSIVCAAVLSGAAVSMCGIIGFLGLIVPNVVRLFSGEKSRPAIAYCIAAGAAFLLAGDTLGKVLAFPYELPCGLFLSLIGAPFLLWMLLKNKKRLGLN